MSVIAVPLVKRKVNAGAHSAFLLCWRMASLMLRLAPSSDDRIAIFGTSGARSFCAYFTSART